MTYVTQDTIWPTAVEIPAAVKQLIDLYYSLADRPDATGERFAADVFSADAEIFASKSVRGTAEINRYRDGAWDTVASRRHTIRQVYVLDAQGTDLMLIAVNTTGLKNGRSVTGEFTARLVVDQPSLDRGQPRLRYVQVWADPTALRNALSDG